MVNWKTAKEFIFSALLGLIAATGYLVTSYELDKVMNYNIANLIGLGVDHVINFFLQYGLFVGKSKHSRWEFFVKFTIGNIVSIIFSQTLFMMVNAFVKCKYPKFYKKEFRKHISLIRYFLGAITYVLVSFPLRKYYMFDHEPDLNVS
jgi:putative flippase GtrA